MVCSGTPFVPGGGASDPILHRKKKKKKIERVQDSRPLSVGGARRSASREEVPLAQVPENNERKK
jgi:hypothetical protein